jgi:cytochrome c oxidase assembly protein subunit 15
MGSQISVTIVPISFLMLGVMTAPIRALHRFCAGRSAGAQAIRAEGRKTGPADGRKPGSTVSDSMAIPLFSRLTQTPGRRAVGLWLLLIAALILAMVVVGGLTRLTGSGLSITQWKPVTGVVPPLSHAAWVHEFDLYKQIPQYRIDNAGMSLTQFKGIYWWEWSHRLLGRLIGFAFLLPFLYFGWRGAITRKRMPRMIVLFLLGGLQGAVGWWMVTSGLEYRVSVSQYRLAIHLGVAIILLGAILWTALEYLRPKEAGAAPVRYAKWGLAFAGLIYMQMLLGALVAGLHAGLIYNTWPSMNGAFFPSETFSSPWWINIFENAGIAQFDHRMVAYVAAFSVLALWLMAMREKLSGWARASANILFGLTLFQILLGIETLLNQAPVGLSAMHQTSAALLFCVAVWHAYELRGAKRIA